MKHPFKKNKHVHEQPGMSEEKPVVSKMCCSGSGFEENRKTDNDSNVWFRSNLAKN